MGGSDGKVKPAKSADEDVTMTFETPAPEPVPPFREQPVEKEPAFQVEKAEEEEYVGTEKEPYNPRLDLENYHYPTIDLMKHYDDNGPTIDMVEQNANKDKIINTLRSFGIEISTIKATVGPTVTLYEITPEQGVRISKIRGLEDDIALSLSALGIRIIAPIPGKGTIGIEVPNSNPKIVSGQSIIGSKKFQESTYDLPIALGKTITNEVFMVDLCKMPHVLVAGATGQGKSVGLNAIITSLLYKKHPAELKFVLVDPKKVEFSIYSVIEHHFLAKLPDGEDAIITDVTKVVQTLNSICVEMDTRYDLLKAAHVRNIKEYNEKFINRRLNPEKGHKFMPYIVVVIDEFGDLIMTAGKDVELPIARIAQLARAVGIHMIIATQRPTTNIITGTIKANFPARIAFRVSAMVDSRTILDRPGANQLIAAVICYSYRELTRCVCSVPLSIRPKWRRLRSLSPASRVTPLLSICPNMWMKMQEVIWGMWIWDVSILCSRMQPVSLLFTSRVPHRSFSVSLPSVIIVPAASWTSWRKRGLWDRRKVVRRVRCSV
mgnify:CR=1 FL=1